MPGYLKSRKKKDQKGDQNQTSQTKKSAKVTAKGGIPKGTHPGTHPIVIHRRRKDPGGWDIHWIPILAPILFEGLNFIPGHSSFFILSVS